MRGSAAGASDRCVGAPSENWLTESSLELTWSTGLPEGVCDVLGAAVSAGGAACRATGSVAAEPGMSTGVVVATASVTGAVVFATVSVTGAVVSATASVTGAVVFATASVTGAVVFATASVTGAVVFATFGAGPWSWRRPR